MDARVSVTLALGLAFGGCSGDAASDPAPEATDEPIDVEPVEPEVEAQPVHFRAEGSPDPLACEEGECSWRPLADAEGCCDRMPSGTGSPTTSAYTTWLGSWRRDHCADVECPSDPGWQAPERCMTQAFCWQGRCRDACAGIPDESSLPVAEISLREAKRRAREIVRGEPEEPSGERPRCADRPFDGVITIGSFAHDRGCRFTGVFVGETFHQDAREASRAFLASYDWANANEREREATARTLVRGILYAMRNPSHLVVTTNADGSVRVDFQTRRSSGMRRGPPPPPSNHSIVIGANGRLR